MASSNGMKPEEAAQVLARRSGFMVQEILRSEHAYRSALRISRATADADEREAVKGAERTLNAHWAQLRGCV